MRTWVGVEFLPPRHRSVLSDPHLLSYRGDQPSPRLGETGDAKPSGQAWKGVGREPSGGEFGCVCPGDLARDRFVEAAGEDARRVAGEDAIDAGPPVPVKPKTPDLWQETRRRCVLGQYDARPQATSVPRQYGAATGDVPCGRQQFRYRRTELGTAR